MWHLNRVLVFSPLLTFLSSFLNNWHSEITLTRTWLFHSSSKTHYSSDFCFWKERFVTCIICSVSRLSGWKSKENSQGKKVSGREKDQKTKKNHIRNRLSYTVHHWFLFFWGKNCSISYSPFRTWGTLSLSFCQRYLHLLNQKTKHNLACLNSFALLNTYKISIKIRRVKHESHDLG